MPAIAGHGLCGPRGEFLRQLARNYGEAPVAAGLVSNGAVLEVLASESGSWTIILTRADGKSCVVAAGSSWEELAVPAQGPEL